MKIKTLLFAISFLLLVVNFSFAQPGTLDTTFNSIDLGAGNGPNAGVNSTCIQSDGKIIIGGSFNRYNQSAINGIARINTDGSLDSSFNPGSGTNFYVKSMSIQIDGKIIMGGSFLTNNGATLNRMTRFNVDGSMDTTFNPGTGANSYVMTTSIQSDGKILVGGYFTDYNGTGRNRIARLNTDGSLDTVFNPGVGADSTIYSISIQSDGKIIIGGDFNNYNGTARNHIARLNQDGSLDATFNPGTGADNVISTTAIQSDGKIMIGGRFDNYNGTVRYHIARLNPDGSLDFTFNQGSGIGGGNSIGIITIQSDGKIIVGGGFTLYNGTARKGIARINTNGSIDTTFNPGNGTNGGVSTISFQTDGKIIIGGGFFSYYYNGSIRKNIARVNTDGTLDTSFDLGLGANGILKTTSIQSDGKIIIGGTFNTYNGITRNHIARVNTDGSLDTTFNPGTGADKEVWATSIQSDGKIVIGGDFTDYNGATQNHLARLNTDGSLDTTFNPGTGPVDAVVSISIQSDGKIIVSGLFYAYIGTTREHIARIHPDGSLDTTFIGVTFTNGSMSTAAIQSNGKIVIGGNFYLINGQTINHIARLDTDGTLDITFNQGGSGADGMVRCITIQTDDKIIIGGDFNNVNGQARGNIARLNVDGTLDTSFDPGNGANNRVYAAPIQSDGKIIIAGSFTYFNGQSTVDIARINTDGTPDFTFNAGTGPGTPGVVYTAAIQSDGKIIIGGVFDNYNGTGKNNVARINFDGFTSVQDITHDDLFSMFPNPTSSELVVSGLDSGVKSELTIYNILGKKVYHSHFSHSESQMTVDVSQFSSGIYFVQVSSGEKAATQKLIIQ